MAMHDLEKIKSDIEQFFAGEMKVRNNKPIDIMNFGRCRGVSYKKLLDEDLKLVNNYGRGVAGILRYDSGTQTCNIHAAFDEEIEYREISGSDYHRPGRGKTSDDYTYPVTKLTINGVSSDKLQREFALAYLLGELYYCQKLGVNRIETILFEKDFSMRNDHDGVPYFYALNLLMPTERLKSYIKPGTVMEKNTAKFVECIFNVAPIVLSDRIGMFDMEREQYGKSEFIFPPVVEVLEKPQIKQLSIFDGDYGKTV